MRENRGEVGPLMTWIVGFIVILFIIIIFLGFTYALFGLNYFERNVVVFENSTIDLITHSEFLNFLSTKIIVDGRERKIIDIIKESLNPYFEIKNEEGLNFPEVFGFNVISGSQTGLRNRFNSEGFSDSDWDLYIKVNRLFQESDEIPGLIFELSKLCDDNSFDTYFLEIPQGTITKDGLKNREIFRDDGFYTTIVHRTNYRGEHLEIKLRLLNECI